MPAWCAYRDAARAEQHRAEQASLRAAMAARKAGTAPLEILGMHEPATIEQMRNCMGFGNVVAGVLAADGHLGYAQPIGGVIAYQGQISISGVGFDIACGNAAAVRWRGRRTGPHDRTRRPRTPTAHRGPGVSTCGRALAHGRGQ